ncbi:cysteine proteinase [Epithele typhae]|uniref:cysteine proteinase n=1 Tax=Epithele typhae TaxID=378194 RepID=UPI0020083DC6|nr:cysteine proteinase [Epithele typhae]KAH9944957.1 cysteine proteinase [Epithele typhae]
MPGVSVLPPPTPTFSHPSGRFARPHPLPAPHAPSSAMQNGVSHHRDTVADIKASAKETAHGVRGASASGLLTVARSQIKVARDHEKEGDLKGALRSYTKAASLAQMLMESSEFKAESQTGKKGALFKEFLDFQQTDGKDLFNKIKVVEGKLVELDKSAAQSAPVEEEVDGAIVKTGGGSIADRMRSLQSAGLTVSTKKRVSREIPTSPALTAFSPPTSPTSPTAPSRPSLLSLQALSPPTGIPLSFSQSLGSPTASVPSPHALVPTSSLGPPSPPSSTSSSPRMPVTSLQEFAQTFPSIDEIEEMDALKLPSNTTGTSSSGSRSSKPSLSDLRANGAPPLIHPKPFPALPMDMGPRPSSTPIPPTIDAFQSRPSSPMRIPMSPTVPRKPSNLSLNSASSSYQRSPIIAPMTPTSEKAELPFKTLFPKILHEWKHKPKFQVLVIDVRTREEFEREHIKAEAVVCIEPSILMRENVTAQSIEDALSVAPRHESGLFTNRDKFDLVAMYDDSSESLGDMNSPLHALSRAIYETAFRKFLKNVPMVLVGGLQAWKREYGDAELVRGGSSSPGRPGLLSNINGASSSTIDSASGTPILGEPKGLGLGHIRVPAESTVFAPQPSTASSEYSGFTGVSMGRARAGTEPTISVDPHAHRPWIPSGVRSPTDTGSPKLGLDTVGSLPSLDQSKRVQRRPPVSRSGSNSVSYPYTPPIPENITMQHVSSAVNGVSPIQYPTLSRPLSSQLSGSPYSTSQSGVNGLSPPPIASINPSPLTRRRSDYIDQSQEAINGLSTRPPDYHEIRSQQMPRLPPPVAASNPDRRLNAFAQPRPPTIQSNYPVTYWPDIQIGTSGLKNLGNTCYMNATIQCLNATVPFSRFFSDGSWRTALNMINKMGTGGQLATAYANILRDMWQGEGGTLSPVTFRKSICNYATQFNGTEQHDSQEFLSFLLDGLHEDLNRVISKPNYQSTPEREAELEKLPTQVASEQEWQLYRMRDDSLVVDFFQGQYRNRMECLTCHKTSTTYNTFMYLTLPVPSGRVTKTTLDECIKAFVKEEVMEKSDAWHCPHCKTLRKATKRLCLSRLPPVLLIHLKRFSVKGPFTDKVETFVEFPLRGLDLTNYMPPPLPPGATGAPSLPQDDPRCQLPPYRYDLYGVTNHFGTLSGGHYTAFIASRGGWLYCDDSRVSPADAKDVVGKPAYILFYKRTKA